MAKSLENPTVEIVGITSKETTINLETGNPSGKDEQNSKTIDSKADYASPNKVNKDVDNEKGSSIGVNEQVEEVQSIPHMGMTTRSRIWATYIEKFYYAYALSKVVTGLD
ncbi:unnamed protein product [Ilex paraguariensis]|uniref:Uncharacterized protein n=1 Tax=Ilex paraguariensis TaxID=185542 RepID=A0ABC8RP72_9AQUA